MSVSKLNLDDNLSAALTEALREDWEQVLEGEEAPRMSWRQRRRFKRMLADPKGYRGRYLQSGKAGGAFGASRFRRRHMPRLAMAGLAAALLGGSALAYSLTGGAFFTRMFDFFGQELGLEAGVADMSQLAKSRDAALGTILETDELRVELLDAVSGGYMSMTALRVTCKQLDTVMELDAEGNSLWQVMFSDIDGTMTENAHMYGTSCRYPGDELGLDLKPNQFYLIVSANSTETILAGTYTLELHDLVKSGMDVKDTVLCAGDWTLSIPLEDGAKYARTVPCGKTYAVGGIEYVLSEIQYSPLAMNLYFSADSREGESSRGFGRSFTDYSVTLKNGRVLGSDWFCCGIGSGSDTDGVRARVTLEFNAPLNVDEIASVQFCGHSVDLTGGN